MAYKRITYGEAYTASKDTLRLEDGVFVADRLKPYNPRMKRSEAFVYYNQKCKDTFNILGIIKRVKVVNDFEKRLPIVLNKIRKQTDRMLKREARKLVWNYTRSL